MAVVMIEVRALRRSELAAAMTVLQQACEFDRAAEVAEEKLFGGAPGDADPMPLAATFRGKLTGVAAVSDRFVRLVAVAPHARGRGIGSALLSRCIELATAAGARELVTVAQPGNYLAPGIDARNRSTLAWLAKRGFVPCARHISLLVDVVGNDRVSTARAAELASAAVARGYRIACMPRDAVSVFAWIDRAFSPAWAFEAARAAQGSPSGLHVAFAAPGDPVAFAAHDGNNRGLGWFGPAGTEPEHRGQALGAALLLACLDDIARAGHPVATIAWIGPREFYEKVCGVRSQGEYHVMRHRWQT